jgi:hypothetical protein
VIVDRPGWCPGERLGDVTQPLSLHPAHSQCHPLRRGQPRPKLPMLHHFYRCRPPADDLLRSLFETTLSPHGTMEQVNHHRR